jgi:hypothetical protein
VGDREDRKLREVVVGRYGYRHEAEFAAGFLEDAGIPYRLQVDDPGLGMPLSASAVVWVHAMDEDRALEILEMGDAAAAEAGDPPFGEVEAEQDGAPLIEDARAAEAGPARPAAPGRGAAGARARANEEETLEGRPRALALVGGAGLFGVAVVGVLPGLVWSLTVGVVGGALLAAGLAGWAPGFLTRLLAGLSGDLRT